MARGEDLLVGLVALLLIPWMIWTMMRGMREGRLPIARAYVVRADRPRPFFVLMAIYAAVLLLIAAIAIDLLFGFKVWNLR